MEEDSQGQNDIDEITVTIDRGDKTTDENIVQLIFTDLDDLRVNLSESGSEDIKKIFDKIFDVINENKKLLKFRLNDAQDDLYKQVTEDIVKQLNSEIAESMQNFEEIWLLSEENN